MLRGSGESTMRILFYFAQAQGVTQ